MTSIYQQVGRMPVVPANYWWVVEFIERLDSVHIELHRRSGIFFSAEVDSKCSVLDFSIKSVDAVVNEVVRDAHTMWKKHAMTVLNTVQYKAWVDKMNTVNGILAGPQVKIKHNRVR